MNFFLFFVHVSSSVSQKMLYFFWKEFICRFICKVWRWKKKNLEEESSSEKAASFEEDKGKWAEASGMDLFSVEIEKKCTISRESFCLFTTFPVWNGFYYYSPKKYKPSLYHKKKYQTTHPTRKLCYFYKN